MSWSGGTDVFVKIWALLRAQIPEEGRQQAAKDIIRVLEDQDWDGVDELMHDCQWPEVRAAAIELYPELAEEED